jgi:hypothetical protein
MQLSVLQQMRCGRQVIVRSLRPVITSKRSSRCELIVKANPKLIQRFKAFNNKRNKSVYDVADAVSDQELEAMVKVRY